MPCKTYGTGTSGHKLHPGSGKLLTRSFSLSFYFPLLPQALYSAAPLFHTVFWKKDNQPLPFHRHVPADSCTMLLSA